MGKLQPEIGEERWKHKEPGMGKSRRADKRSMAYRVSAGYSNAKTAREAHPLKTGVTSE